MLNPFCILQKRTIVSKTREIMNPLKDLASGPVVDFFREQYFRADSSYNLYPLNFYAGVPLHIWWPDWFCLATLHEHHSLHILLVWHKFLFRIWSYKLGGRLSNLKRICPWIFKDKLFDKLVCPAFVHMKSFRKLFSEKVSQRIYIYINIMHFLSISRKYMTSLKYIFEHIQSRWKR